MATKQQTKSKASEDENPRAGVRLSDWGLDPGSASLPFFKPTGKPTKVRLVERLPTSKSTRLDMEIYATFKAETEDGATWLWDITSKRLFAMLGELRDVTSWFEISARGSGTTRLFTVTPCKE